MPRSQGDITAAALLGTWTDSDTAMQIVGTSLGIFGPGLLDPERALSNETPLRNALFDVLLSLVEGGAIDMRPTEDGLYAFRWRPDYAVAGLISETSSSIDIDPPSPYLAELVRTRHERDEALGRAQFAEALAGERERLLRSATAPAAPTAPKRTAARRSAPKPPDEIDLREPTANEAEGAENALDAPAPKGPARKPAARKATKPKPVAAAKAVPETAPAPEVTLAPETETEPEVVPVPEVVMVPEVVSVPDIAAAPKPVRKRAAKTKAPSATVLPAVEPASEPTIDASVAADPAPEAAPAAVETAVEIASAAEAETAVEAPAEAATETAAETGPEPIEETIPVVSEPAPKVAKSKIAKVRGKRKGLAKRAAKAGVGAEAAASAIEPGTNEVVYLTQPEPAVDIDLTAEDVESERAEDESAPRRAKWSGYTLDKPRAHLSSVERLADEG